MFYIVTYTAHSFIPLKKGGEDFGSSEIGGVLALISGFWGDLEKKGGVK